MSRKNQVLYCSWWVVMMICSPLLLVDGGQADKAPPPQQGILIPGTNVPFFTGLLPPIYGEAKKCWSSLWRIQECATRILSARFGNMFVYISPDCCKAFVAIDKHCWPKMFPFTPLFAPRLNTTCTAHL